jgi:hypothetical protein
VPSPKIPKRHSSFEDIKTAIIESEGGNKTCTPVEVRGRARGATTTKKLFVELAPPNILLSLSQKEIKRQEIIHELFTTERQYVTDMRTTIKVFRLYSFHLHPH